MIRPNDRGEQHIIYIMLSGLSIPPQNRPPTLFFSVTDRVDPLCPPKF